MIEADDVRAELRRQTANSMLTDWCKRNGISRAFAYRVLNGVDQPTERICKALGFRKDVATTYTREEP